MALPLGWNPPMALPPCNNKQLPPDQSRGARDRGEKEGEEKKTGHLKFKRVDWIWDADQFTYKLQKTVETSVSSQHEGYVFHVRRTFDHDGKFERTFVDIKSKPLRECLQDILKNMSGISLADESPKVDPNILFLHIDEFRAYLRSLRGIKPKGESRKERRRNRKYLDEKRQHLQVLIEYIDIDFENIKNTLEPMLQSGLITFDLLWALWKPGALVYSSTYGSVDVPRVFRVDIAERQYSMIKGNFYHIEFEYVEYDGKRFGFSTAGEEISEFKGARKISSLPCYPLQYYKAEAEINFRKRLIERGKKFTTLAGIHFKAYSGMAFMKRKKGVHKVNIKSSRIMIDPAMFRLMNPNYQLSRINPKDHDSLRLSTGSSASESEEDFGADCPKAKPERETAEEHQVGEVTMASEAKYPKGKHDTKEEDLEEAFGIVETPENTESIPEKSGTQTDGGTPTDTVAKSDEEAQNLTDDEYLITSPVVLGFAFAEKQWLEFDVSSIKDIQWNANTWDSLVLEPETKDLIKALVQSRKLRPANNIDDVIQGKGKGLVTVLHGPPGTGKTLTVEGISELLKCPLYIASAGELTTDVRFLEQGLQKILDICHAWGAILLLDEADVFLEQRNLQDIHRNALVSIFLRKLEYFQGTLFLTTNRVETFDEAFQSRVHIGLRYDKLNTEAKGAIFRFFIKHIQAYGKLEVNPFDEADIAALAKHDLNGREIKNVMCSAQDLAVDKGEPLKMRHVRVVLDMHTKFGRDLKGGSGFEDAMRSYF